MPSLQDLFIRGVRIGYKYIAPDGAGANKNAVQKNLNCHYEAVAEVFVILRERSDRRISEKKVSVFGVQEMAHRHTGEGRYPGIYQPQRGNPYCNPLMDKHFIGPEGAQYI